MEQSIAQTANIVSTNKISTPEEPQKVNNDSADGGNADLTSLVPFLQLLNQQLSLLNPKNDPANELTNAAGEKASVDFLLSKNENINGLLKENRPAALVEELPGMNISLPDNENGAAAIDIDFEAKLKKQIALNGSSQEVDKTPALKTEDIKNSFKPSDQALRDNNFILTDDQNINSDGSKISAGKIGDKLGLAKIDTLQTFSANLAEQFKNVSKGNNISIEKHNQDISLNSLSATNNGVAKINSIDDISSGQIIDRVVSGIKETASSDGGRLKITLSPPSLGTLEMDVTVRNNKVEVVIVADNKDVQQTLNTHLDRLKGSLQNQGLTIDRCDVLMQNNREGYQQNFSQQAFYRDGSEKNSNAAKEKFSEELKPIAKALPPIINRSSLNPDNISIFA